MKILKYSWKGISGEDLIQNADVRMIKKLVLLSEALNYKEKKI